MRLILTAIFSALAWLGCIGAALAGDGGAAKSDAAVQMIIIAVAWLVVFPCALVAWWPRRRK